MKAFLRRPGVRQLLHKRPWTVIRAALRRTDASDGGRTGQGSVALQGLRSR